MRWLSGVFVAFAFASVAAACSSGESRPAGNDGEAMGSVTQAITTACNTLTVGLPCDPDGPAGPKLECEGVCYVATTGLVGCIAVAAGTLNGVTCGTAGGVGDAACTRYCSGKTCLAAIAPLGTACRPNLSSDPCDGQCDGTGKCDSLGGAACAFGRDEQLCTFATCNFSKATQCKTQNLNKNTLCSDSDACSIGKCSTGVCVAGPAAGCDDGNSCTDDACDSVGGGCVGTPNNANSCSDGNACLTGEHCAAGKCVAGTTPVNCDDSNACTADSCDPNTGCAHIAKSCSDSDACTADSCDPATGACSSAPISCADADPCTVDACDPVTGCSHVNMNCDDADACTADSCANGTCGHATVSCDDNDACTTDSCDALSGCTHVAIVGCGGGGDGGAGGIGSDGNAGAAAGGASDGGAPPTGGTAGSETGGTAGTEAGGTAGTEAGGTAGTEAGGTPSAGTASGGNSTAGTTSAGSPSGGTESSGGTTATGGTSTPEGGAMDGGTTGSGPRPVNDSGCGCRVPAQPSPGGSAAWALGLLGLTALLRRRRAV